VVHVVVASGRLAESLRHEADRLAGLKVKGAAQRAPGERGSRGRSDQRSSVSEVTDRRGRSDDSQDAGG
jgi:hypothetical protein